METTLEQEKLDRGIPADQNVSLEELAKGSSVLPLIVEYDQNEVVEVIFCESISGGADYFEKLPSELTLVRVKKEGESLVKSQAAYVQKKEAKMSKSRWVLLKDVNFFGRHIPAGTIFHQVGDNYYWPSVNGARVPAMQIDFYTVKNNPEYFLEIKP